MDIIMYYVSLSYIAAFWGNSDHSLFFFLNLLMMSYKVAHTKKYYCLSLNSFPLGVLSFGYKTLLMYSALYLFSIALK